MVQIRWTKVARDDLKEIHDYIALDSFHYAKLQVVKLRVKTKVLKRQPLIGKPVPEYQNDQYRELLEGNYRIIYKLVNADQVDVLTVHHSSRKLETRRIE